MRRVPAVAKIRTDPYKSRDERLLADRLATLLSAKRISSFGYELHQFNVVGGWYTPDFEVVAGKRIYQIECKGGKRDKRSKVAKKSRPYWKGDSRLRYKSAAERFGCYIWLTACQIGGCWTFAAWYKEDQEAVDKVFGGVG